MKSEELLAKQMKDKSLSSSYIFSGADVDSTYQKALSLAEKLKISKFSIIEVEAGKKEKKSKLEIRVGAIRELIRRVNLTPSVGEYKLAIIKSADVMNIEAANTLLKTLEEPPKNLLIILLSENLKLLPTIISRCQVISFSDKREKKSQGGLEKLSDKSERLKKIFSEIERLSDREDLDNYLESVLFDLHYKLREKKDYQTVKKIKNVFAACSNLRLTTNKRLVLENLYLSLIQE